MAGDDLDACDFPIILGVAISHHIWGCSFISGQLRTYSYKGIVVVTLELGDLFSEERRDILVSLRCGEGLMSDWHTSCLFQRNPSWLMV